MAIPIFVAGTVAQIKIAPRLLATGNPTATVVVNDQNTNMQETFVLWNHALTEFVPPALSIAEISSLSLLREALINKLQVTIITAGPTSAQIQSVAVWS